jgi:Antitoxin Phd_YefM, type II toxin-antitoxin system
MTALRVTFDEILPIREAVRGLPRALERLDRGETAHFVITRRNEPRAVLLNVERYEQLLRAEASSSRG